MKKHYDFTRARKNPYAKGLKRQLTIRLDPETLRYFQDLALELAVPYQTLMNMYLRECATLGLRPGWSPGPGRGSGASARRATGSKRKAG